VGVCKNDGCSLTNSNLTKECDSMKKLNGAKICYGLSVLLFIGFIINTIFDYGRYNSTLNSAPFYVWIIANAIYFIVPSIIALIVGFVIKKKTKTD
jgi:hypothetical protein